MHRLNYSYFVMTPLYTAIYIDATVYPKAAQEIQFLYETTQQMPYVQSVLLYILA